MIFKKMAIAAAWVFSTAHYIVFTVAINAGQTSRLVYVRGQVMVFHSIGQQLACIGEIRGSVFFVEIVFVKSVVVEADMIAIMAGETLEISWWGRENVARHLTVGKGQMTGCTANPMGYRREVVAFVIDVAA